MSVIDQQNKEKNDIALISVISNVLLVVLKLVVGLMIGSVSVISEAIHSGVDLVAAFIAFLSVRTSSQPPDTKHAFGHGKVENIAGVVEALLIIGAALLIIWEALDRLLHGGAMEDVGWGIAIMFVSTVVNYLVGRKQMQVARRTESIALEADAVHHNTDVLTSLGIFAGLVVIKLTGLAWIDPVFAILIALPILWTGIDLTFRSIKDLMDVNLPADEVAEIERIIQDHSGKFAGYQELRTRRSGSDRFIDLHLVVSPDMSVEQAHNLVDHIEKDITDRFQRTSVITHVEPCDNDETCKGCQAKECSKYVAPIEEP
jgi:cation diffusion facilitator family transporter